jgi:hypothetical protein
MYTHLTLRFLTLNITWRLELEPGDEYYLQIQQVFD